MNTNQPDLKLITANNNQDFKIKSPLPWVNKSKDKTLPFRTEKVEDKVFNKEIVFYTVPEIQLTKALT
jgi:hypothetical protein